MPNKAIKYTLVRLLAMLLLLAGCQRKPISSNSPFTVSDKPVATAMVGKWQDGSCLYDSTNKAYAATETQFTKDNKVNRNIVRFQDAHCQQAIANSAQAIDSAATTTYSVAATKFASSGIVQMVTQYSDGHTLTQIYKVTMLKRKADGRDVLTAKQISSFSATPGSRSKRSKVNLGSRISLKKDSAAKANAKAMNQLNAPQNADLTLTRVQ